MSKEKSSKKRVLIISHDKIGTSMAGPGIRYHYMAQELSKNFDVTIGFFDPSYLPDTTFKKKYAIESIDSNDFQENFTKFDTVIALYLNEYMIEFCNKQNIFVVFDLYVPAPVENLALALFSGNKITQETDFVYKRTNEMYSTFFENGDLFLVSNRRQLDYWIGYVFGSDLIRVSGYVKRPVFDRFIYAPMGIDTKSKANTTHTKDVVRGVLKGITHQDKVILWTGGIWNWYDGATLIQAMTLLKGTRPDIKLVFFGTKHPNPDVPSMKEAADTFELAGNLGLLNKTVFIHEGWVDYPDRINYLLEADAAINTTKDTIESEFSHRTRVVDHFLTGLPTIATSGDYLTDEVITKHALGYAVPPNDAEILAQAIIDILDEKNNKRFRKNILEIRDSFEWHETLRPLTETLLSSPNKLQRVTIKHTARKRPNRKIYKFAKRILPRSTKKAIIKVLRYGK